MNIFEPSTLNSYYLTLIQTIFTVLGVVIGLYVIIQGRKQILHCSGTVKLATDLEVIYDITSGQKVNNEQANQAHIQCGI